MLQLLNTLFDSGVYDQLFKAGLISAKVSYYRDIYMFVDAQMKARGITKEQAVIEAELKFQCGRATVYRALSSMAA